MFKAKQVNHIHVSTAQKELEMTNKAVKAVKTVKSSKKLNFNSNEAILSVLSLQSSLIKLTISYMYAVKVSTQ